MYPRLGDHLKANERKTEMEIRKITATIIAMATLVLLAGNVLAQGLFKPAPPNFIAKKQPTVYQHNRPCMDVVITSNVSNSLKLDSIVIEDGHGKKIINDKRAIKKNLYPRNRSLVLNHGEKIIYTMIGCPRQVTTRYIFIFSYMPPRKEKLGVEVMYP